MRKAALLAVITALSVGILASCGGAKEGLSNDEVAKVSSAVVFSAYKGDSATKRADDGGSEGVVVDNPEGGSASIVLEASDTGDYGLAGSVSFTDWVYIDPDTEKEYLVDGTYTIGMDAGELSFDIDLENGTYSIACTYTYSVSGEISVSCGDAESTSRVSLVTTATWTGSYEDGVGSGSMSVTSTGSVGDEDVDLSYSYDYSESLSLGL